MARPERTHNTIVKMFKGTANNVALKETDMQLLALTQILKAFKKSQRIKLRNTIPNCVVERRQTAISLHLRLMCRKTSESCESSTEEHVERIVPHERINREAICLNHYYFVM